MKIYVKSRGVSQDYCWLDAEQGIEIDKPPELPKFKVDIDDFSLILQRQGNQLALLVTGLTSSKRVDYQNRKIRNSVLWVTDDESCLRSLTIQALGEEGEPLGEQLAAQLDDMISSTTPEPGFQVDFSKMETLAKRIPRLESSEPSTLEGKIGNLSALKVRLRNELMQSSFPEGDGLFLVVVSPTLSQTNLENDNIWRGLSNQVDSDDGWITLPLKKNQQSLTGKKSRSGSSGFQSTRPFQSVRPATGQLGTFAKIVFPWLGWFLSLILAGTLLIFYQQYQKDLYELKENRNLTLENSQLQEENEKLVVQNKKLQEYNEKINTENSQIKKLIQESEEFLELLSTKVSPIIEGYKRLGAK
jgi:hypothetical protein